LPGVDVGFSLQDSVMIPGSNFPAFLDSIFFPDHQYFTHRIF
jgi:hypothetical protein